MRLALHAMLVRDYDEAIDFFVDRLGFTLTANTDQGGGKRWVVVTPGPTGAGLLLAKAVGPDETARIGDPMGGRVALFLETDDFDAQHARMLAAGVKFLEAPRHEPYGVVAVFEDLYGVRWDLIEPREALD